MDLLINGMDFDDVGMFFVIINWNIEKVSKMVMLREIFFLELGGRWKMIRISRDIIIYGIMMLIR